MLSADSTRLNRVFLRRVPTDLAGDDLLWLSLHRYWNAYRAGCDARHWISVKTASAKAKGRNAAKKVKEILLKGTDLEDGDILVTPSGVTGDDLTLSPAAIRLYPLAIEVKCQETLRIWQALEQAESHAGDSDREPVLFFKRNRSKLYATVDAEFFAELMRRAGIAQR